MCLPYHVFVRLVNEFPSPENLKRSRHVQRAQAEPEKKVRGYLVGLVEIFLMSNLCPVILVVIPFAVVPVVGAAKQGVQLFSNVPHADTVVF